MTCTVEFYHQRFILNLIWVQSDYIHHICPIFTTNVLNLGVDSNWFKSNLHCTLRRWIQEIKLPVGSTTVSASMYKPLYNPYNYLPLNVLEKAVSAET